MTIATWWMLGALMACGEAPAPEPTVGTLSTEPSAAVVFVGDDRVGTTPYTPSAGDVPVTVVLRANGFASRSAEIGTSDLTVTLAPGCEELLGYDGVLADGYALTPEDLVSQKPGQLSFLRNEVFARYGRSFNKEKFAKHFAKKSWYEANKHYDDGVLTEVDKKNLALIKSFEGEPQKWTKRYLERNQFRGQGRTLAFVDADKVMVGKGADLYEWEQHERHWLARGEWVITWNTPDTFRPSAKGARLWKLDMKTGRILESVALRAPRG